MHIKALMCAALMALVATTALLPDPTHASHSSSIVTYDSGGEDNDPSSEKSSLLDNPDGVPTTGKQVSCKTQCQNEITDCIKRQVMTNFQCRSMEKTCEPACKRNRRVAKAKAKLTRKIM